MGGQVQGDENAGADGSPACSELVSGVGWIREAIDASCNYYLSEAV